MQIMSRYESRRTKANATVCLVGGATAVALALCSASATAAVTTCALTGKECSFTISNNSIQKAPTLFKLQAQISQAKIPLVDATFSSLTVNIKSGSTVVCSEPFTGIKVRNGVLNLEIGRKVQGCQLDDAVAKHNDLAFQVCIGDGGDAANCLKPIQISSVPYALKANFASQAQEAYRAEVAARAHYAQRLTADASTLEQLQIGSGYYDFEKADAARTGLLTVVNASDAANVMGGFLQWTPIDPADNVLNLSAKNAVSNALEPLRRLNVHAVKSSIWGELDVLKAASFRAGIWVAGARGIFENGLNVAGATFQSVVPTNIYSTLRVTDLGTFSNGLSVTGGVVRVSTDAEFSNGIYVSGVKGTFTSGLEVSGAEGKFANGLTVDSGLKIATGNLEVKTNASFGGGGETTTVAFGSGTTVDMSASTVKLPGTISVSSLAVATTSLTAQSDGATDCKNGTYSVTAKFCGITKVAYVSGATAPACTIIKYLTGYRLQACGAVCAANCF